MTTGKGKINLVFQPTYHTKCFSEGLLAIEMGKQK